MLFVLSCVSLSLWVLLILQPWQPYRTRERIEASASRAMLSHVTVLIPARNEARHIGNTLRALQLQGPDLAVVVVDDGSTDDTVDICRDFERHGDHDAAETLAVANVHSFELTVVEAGELPEGWGGKLWALQQGLEKIERRYTLLLDADIELAPYTIASLLDKARVGGYQLVSVMATLRHESWVERLLAPPFVFFFKLLYPFRLVAKDSSKIAAAAGGCVLVETDRLKDVDGFSTIRGELIDDCSLATLLKSAGCRLWLGLSRSVSSRRTYDDIGSFWRMVSRTAYTQLRYSVILLLVTTALMVLAFCVPWIAFVGAPASTTGAIAIATLLLISLAYLPTVRFYRLNAIWTLTLPVAAAMYLAMTWGSAVSYWRGTRAQWKNRRYQVSRSTGVDG